MARIAWAGLAALALLTPNPGMAARKQPPPPVAAPAPVVPSVRTAVDLWRAGDYPAAVAMWQPFANAGDPDAMFNIGQAYKLGRAVPKDSVLARDWYRRAAMKGHLPAQANLGILLFQAGDKLEALRWLKAAADKNEMRAQYVLGVANWNGDGTPRNLTLAYAYLSRAAAQGLPEAGPALASLTAGITPLERANGWASATSLAAGNGIPAEFGGAGGARAPVAVASTDAYRRDQVIKPLPRTPAPPVAVAQAAPLPSPLPATAPLPAAAPPAAASPPAAVPLATAAAAVPSVVASATAAPRPLAPVVTTTAIPPSAPAATLPPPAPKPVIAAAPPPKAALQPKPAPEAAPPPAKPLAVAVATPKPRTPTGWRVQLGAFAKKAQAEAAWTEVKTKQKQIVAKTQPIFMADGNVTKLQMGPYASKAAARDACARIAFTGRACFVTEG